VGSGVMRHADTDYEIAIECAKAHGLTLLIVGNR
jgi:urocanate hydratase